MSIFIIFAPDVIFNSFWYLVEVKQNEDFVSLCRKINEVLARIDEETHDIRDVNHWTWKNWLEVSMQNFEKKYISFRNTLTVTVQFFENSETVLFSFFKIVHQQYSLKFQENVVIGCPAKMSKNYWTSSFGKMKGLQKAQRFIMNWVNMYSFLKEE